MAIEEIQSTTEAVAATVEPVSETLFSATDALLSIKDGSGIGDWIGQASDTVQSATHALIGPDNSASVFEQHLGSFMDRAGEVSHYIGTLSYVEILIALIAAATMGAFIAFHPKRQAEAGGPASDRELKNTLIMIPVAGVVMVALVQDSLARAFGLVGLGSFVRFRTNMRNPLDLSIIFILIGLGMACGLKMYEFAITITGFLYVLLYILNFTSGSYS
ncbi:MAG: DUF4956 domain-containing protein, partial [bacterium]|nr:DUF4956 domain-containing protein [bacterium]